MSRVSGKTAKAVSVFVTAALALLASVFVAAAYREPAAPLSVTSSTCTQVVKEGSLQNGLWTDACAGRWVKDNRLIRREAQSFVIARHIPQLVSPLPITMAYYDLGVTDSLAYDPGATNSLREPVMTPVFYFDGSQELKMPFPPSDAKKTCKYRVVLFVGFQPKGSETPDPGNLAELPKKVHRVLNAADDTSDPDLKKRCAKPSSTALPN